MNRDQAIELWLSYKAKTLAPKSLAAYTSNIQFIHEHLPESAWPDLSRAQANQVINKEGSVNSRQLRRAVMDNFMEWCIKEGFATHRPQTEVFQTQADRRNNDAIMTITEETFRKMLSTIDDGTVREVMLIAFYMGLRIGELLYLRPAWILKEGEMLRIGDLYSWGLEDEFHPKSQKEYDNPIAIPAEVSALFRRYLDMPPYEPVFGFGSDSSIRRAIKESFYGLPENIRETFTAHHLRHSCISYWLNERRVPIQEVQRLARHSRMLTTMKYYHPDDNVHWRSFQ